MSTLTKAIKSHVAHSALDRTPADALKTMVGALFNILGCHPLSALNTIQDQYYIDLMSPERMKELDTINGMVQAYFQQVESSAPFHDVLSDLAGEFHGRGGKSLGQFFTPRNTAIGAARMSVDPASFRDIVARNEPITVSDATGCGTGALLLGMLSVLHQKAPDLLPHVLIFGMDKDADMVRTTAVQLIWNCLIHSLPLKGLIVWHGDVIADYMREMPPAIIHQGLTTQFVAVDEAALSMAIYQMRYEKLMQFSMVIEVEADTLHEAMAMNHSVHDQEWIEEEWFSGPRLYNVSNETGDELVYVHIPDIAYTAAADKVDLHDVWGNPEADDEEVYRPLDRAEEQVITSYRRLSPVFTDEGLAELARGELEVNTAPALGTAKASRL